VTDDPGHPARPTTPAVGGERQVPVPDPIARDYLLLGLRLDQHVPGLVDGYFGPADLKARVDLGSVPAPHRLATDAAALQQRLPDEVEDPARRHWLELQLTALETQAAALAGDQRPYLEHVERCFAWRPERRRDALFEAAAAGLDELLPGPGPLADRLTADDERWTVPVDAARRIVDAVVPELRERSARLFGLPDGESLRVSFVSGQPWSGYNWYDGGGRSRVDLNTDLPLRIPSLLTTIVHETYPGHHLEHAHKERTLVDERGWLESSLLAINTPECLISEGLANLGQDLVMPLEELPERIAEAATLAGIELARDPGRLREAAQRRVALGEQRKLLDATLVNAALRRHLDGQTHDEVERYLIDVGRWAPDAAAKRLEFIEHPLWRTYVFVYFEGEALLRRWLEAVAPKDRPARFARLLREPLTPVAIARELDAADMARGTAATATAPQG
jgi:hypothetical protein